MKITRIVAISLTAALAFGCRYDAPEEAVVAPDPDPEPCTVDCGETDPGTEVLLNSVLIKDESTTEAGEMRFSLPAAQASGELSVNIRVNAADAKLSYIGLYGSSTSTDDALIDLKMGGINSDYASDATDGYAVIKLRSKKVDGNKVDDQDTALEYPSEEWVNVSIKWDAGQVTIALADLEGVAIGSSETHAMQNVLDVEKIIFKISDTSGVTSTDAPYYVDDIMVYSDTAQTALTFSDSFTSATLSTGYALKGTVALTDAQNAIVPEGDDTDPGTDPGTDPTTPNLAAQILDTDAGGADGELRIKLADQTDATTTITAGQVSATILLQADEDTVNVIDDSTSVSNTGYVSLYGTGTSSSNLAGDIIFSAGKMKYRDDSGSQQTVEGVTYTEGEAIDFVAKWDATTYSFSIDKGVTFHGPYTSREQLGVQVVSFKLGDKSGVASDELIVDNIEILDGSTSVFSDDFESYSAGHDLDDNPYNSNSAEATVQEKEL